MSIGYHVIPTPVGFESLHKVDLQYEGLLDSTNALRLSNTRRTSHVDGQNDIPFYSLHKKNEGYLNEEALTSFPMIRKSPLKLELRPQRIERRVVLPAPLFINE